MKKLFFLICILSFSGYAQPRKYTINSNNVIGFFEFINEKESVYQKVKILNSTNEEIFLPIMDDKELFYFILGGDSHSYTGAINSKLGAPNLGGDLKLIKLEPTEFYEFEIRMKKTKEIINYYYGFDYVRDIKNAVYKKNNTYWIKTIDYVNNNQIVLSKIE